MYNREAGTCRERLTRSGITGSERTTPTARGAREWEAWKEDCLNAELGSRLRRPRTAGAGRPETLRATRDGKSEGAVARSRCACGCEIRSLL